MSNHWHSLGGGWPSVLCVANLHLTLDQVGRDVQTCMWSRPQRSPQPVKPPSPQDTGRFRFVNPEDFAKHMSFEMTVTKWQGKK